MSVSDRHYGVRMGTSSGKAGSGRVWRVPTSASERLRSDRIRTIMLTFAQLSPGSVTRSIRPMAPYREAVFLTCRVPTMFIHSRNLFVFGIAGCAFACSGGDGNGLFEPAGGSAGRNGATSTAATTTGGSTVGSTTATTMGAGGMPSNGGAGGSAGVGGAGSGGSRLDGGGGSGGTPKQDGGRADSGKDGSAGTADAGLVDAARDAACPPDTCNAECCSGTHHCCGPVCLAPGVLCPIDIDADACPRPCGKNGGVCCAEGKMCCDDKCIPASNNLMCP